MLIDTLLHSFRNLGRKRVRSWLTIMGIAIGVASVVLIASIGDIGKSSINQELDSLGVGGILISGGSKTAGTPLASAQIEAIQTSPAVELVVPITVDYTRSYMRGLMLDVVAWGVDAGSEQVIPMETLYGRQLSAADIASGKQVCVVDQNLAMAYYKRENIVGKSIALQFAAGQVELEIIGVVSSGGNIMQGLMGDYIPSFLYMPYPTMQRYSGRNTFDQVAVKIKEGVDGDVASAQLLAKLNRTAQGAEGYKAENLFAQKEKFNNILNIVTLVLSAIAAVSLVVAGLGIMTIMLVSVNERTREIGIKKSIGASRANIMAEFLIEAFTISLLGSIIGSGIGVSIVAIGCMLFQIPFLLNYSLMLFCMLFTVVIGMIFGVYPASLASKLKPVDALRCE